MRISFSAFTRRLLGYFLRGILFVTPILITGYVIVATVQFLDGLIPGLYPGVSVAVILLGITLIGVYSYSFVFQWVLGVFERLIFRTPGLKLLYSSVKDLLMGFSRNRKLFKQPVMVVVNKEASVHKLGFITQENLQSIGIGDMVAVYFPHSYNFSGELFVVPRENVRVLKDFPSANAMKFIVTGGVTDLISPAPLKAKRKR